MTEFRPAPKPGPKKKRPRARNLSGWREAVLRLYGPKCRSCGYRGWGDGKAIDVHHLIFKSHCRAEYIDDPRNGIPLCNEFGNGCHQAVHGGRLKISPDWLPRVVLECLEEQGLVWDSTGSPTGTLSVYFGKERHDDHAGRRY